MCEAVGWSGPRLADNKGQPCNAGLSTTLFTHGVTEYILALTATPLAFMIVHVTNLVNGKIFYRSSGSHFDCNRAKFKYAMYPPVIASAE